MSATDLAGEFVSPSGPHVNHPDSPEVHDRGFRASSLELSYQENLPQVGADRVNNSDGVFVDTNDLTILSNPTPTSSNFVALYAVKHNPFVYFKSVQENGGLNKVMYCGFDPKNDGTQNGLNPGLIFRGDAAVQRIVGAIKGSPAWGEGHNAIVVWDENDYAVNTPNRVLTTVETNYARTRVVSNNYYNHFSLLKTIEGALGLPCLNHACDASVAVMSDLFGR